MRREYYRWDPNCPWDGVPGSNSRDWWSMEPSDAQLRYHKQLWRRSGNSMRSWTKPDSMGHASQEINEMLEIMEASY